MSEIPSLPYTNIIHALQKDGWNIIRQKGGHIGLQKRIGEETLKLILPAHRPVKRSTLNLILMQTKVDVERFTALL